MNTIKPSPEQISVIIERSKDFSLIDKRLRTSGINFGTIQEVAKNLGVTLKDTDKGLVASAPKMRMQIFVEKLHFSGVRYREA
jgi:hypothetical protein